MRYGRLLIALLIATAPAFAGAQRGTTNIRGERAGNVGGRGFALPRSSDLEDHNPVGVVLEKKKLSLSDSQVTALKEITGMSPVDQERMATARTTSMGLMRAMREGDESSRQETLNVLTAEQKPKAEEFWKEDAEDFGAKMPGGGMPRGGRFPRD